MMFTGVLDKSAISLSMVCVLHCIALPFLVIMVPQLTAYWFAGEDFHLMKEVWTMTPSAPALGERTVTRPDGQCTLSLGC